MFDTIDLSKRQLRFVDLGNNAEFDLPDNWRFCGFTVSGTGTVTVTNQADTPETQDFTEGDIFNMYLPSESFESIKIATDANSTCRISYFE